MLLRRGIVLRTALQQLLFSLAGTSSGELDLLSFSKAQGSVFMGEVIRFPCVASSLAGYFVFSVVWADKNCNWESQLRCCGLAEPDELPVAIAGPVACSLCWPKTVSGSVQRPF